MSNFGAAIYITIYGLHCHRPLLPHGPCHTPITPSIESHTPINIWPLFIKKTFGIIQFEDLRVVNFY